MEDKNPCRNKAVIDTGNNRIYFTGCIQDKSKKSCCENSDDVILNTVLTGYKELPPYSGYVSDYTIYGTH